MSPVPGVRVRIVIQARTTSRRLPCKVFLPVGDQPAVLLAARRAARSGLDTLIATSLEETDDRLANLSVAAGFRVLRGPLDDVHARFLLATKDLADQAVIVRLTADNVFPDAGFIEGIVQQLCRTGAEYVAPRWPEDGGPYGLSAEAFRLGAFRRLMAHSREDREHVTPPLRRSVANSGMATGFACAHLRATIDTVNDYGCVKAVFADVPDPIAEPWQGLCARLYALPSVRVPWTVAAAEPEPTMTLGGAQFGGAYGIANTTGVPSQGAVSRLIHRAVDHGVLQIDTARLYGDSEALIGVALQEKGRGEVRIITKLPEIHGNDSMAAVQRAGAHVEASLRALRLERLDTLLLHRADTISAAGGAVWDKLLALKGAGRIGRLGVSVQNPEELRLAFARRHDISAVQMPFNLLDTRWSDAAVKPRDISLHVRSTLLQGLLGGVSAARWPLIPGLDAQALLDALSALVREFGRVDIADLALAYVRAQPWVTSLVIGCETEVQLASNIAAFSKGPLDLAECDIVNRCLPRLPDALVNPALWPS